MIKLSEELYVRELCVTLVTQKLTVNAPFNFAVVTRVTDPVDPVTPLFVSEKEPEKVPVTVAFETGLPRLSFIVIVAVPCLLPPPAPTVPVVMVATYMDEAVPVVPVTDTADEVVVAPALSVAIAVREKVPLPIVQLTL